MTEIKRVADRPVATPLLQLVVQFWFPKCRNP